MSSTTPRNQTKKKSLFERFGSVIPNFSNIRSRFRRNQTVKVTAPQTAPRTAEDIELKDYKTLMEAGPQKVKDAFKFDIEKLKVQDESSEEFIKKLRKELFSINKEIAREKDRAKIKQLQLTRRDIIKTIQDTQKLINHIKSVQSGERRSVARLERTQRQISAQMQAATKNLEKARADGKAYSESISTRTRTRKKGTGGMKKRRKYKKRY